MKRLILVALLFCSSHQFGMKLDDRTSSAGRNNRKQERMRSGGSGYSTGMGPYDVDVKLLRLCDNPGNDVLKVIVEPYNTKTNGVSKILYRGNFTVPFTQEEFDTLNATVSVYKKKDNKYFRLVKYEENLRKICETSGKDVYVGIRKEIGLEGDQFIIPKGLYTFNDWELDIHLPPPVLEYGDYKAILELLQENNLCLCVEIHAQVKQKE